MVRGSEDTLEIAGFVSVGSLVRGFDVELDLRLPLRRSVRRTVRVSKSYEA